MINSILTKIKNGDWFLSKSLFKILLFIYEKILWWITIHFIYDYFRYVKYSTLFRLNKIEKFDSMLMKESHRIEKWLSFRNFRPFFWKKVIYRIFNLLDSYWNKYISNKTILVAFWVLDSYIEYHENNWYKKDSFLSEISYKLSNIRKKLSIPTDYKEWWIYNLNKSDFLDNWVIDIEKFYNSRHTVRDFSNEPVDINLIKQAINLSIKTPSVCNRQPWRTYLVKDANKVKKALTFQNGNVWFSNIDKLLIITTELGAFHAWYERYQNWIDWWMFSMSLVNALHALGLWTCCLNWSAFFYNDIKIRKVIPIKNSESVIMMIAVWNIPKELKVAQSPRKGLDEILTEI